VYKIFLSVCVCGEGKCQHRCEVKLKSHVLKLNYNMMSINNNNNNNNKCKIALVSCVTCSYVSS
jgi:hypothetical protein